MSQLQFRSDDTPNAWAEAFGDGSDGSLTISSTTTDSTPNTTCSGSLNNNILSVGSSIGFSNNNLVLIHQSRNGGDGAGVWMLNKIISGGGTTTWTMKYNLTHNFDTTAQVYLLKQYSSVAINSALSSTSWNGSTGGILAILCGGTVNGNGSINLSGKGYRGQTNSSGGYVGKNAEGTLGIGGSESTSANGNGGGGGGGSNNSPWVQGNGGGGGANDTTNGSSGITTGGGNNSYGAGGALGNSAGLANLSIMVFGGGGGRGGFNFSNSLGYGGNGAALLLVIAPVIDFSSMSSISLNGDQGTASDYQRGAGGSGAGGSACFQGRTINLGTGIVSAKGGARVFRNGSTAGDEDGGSGGDGRIYARYSGSVSGTSTPTLISESDNSFTSTSTSSSTSTSTTSTSTTTTMSFTTSTSTSHTTSTSRSTSTSTTSTSSSTSISTTSTITSTSTTLQLRIRVEKI